jgi:hypothetical protein
MSNKIIVFHKFGIDNSLDKLVKADAEYFSKLADAQIKYTQSKLRRIIYQLCGNKVLNTTEKIIDWIPRRVLSFIHGYPINPSIESNRFYFWNLVLSSFQSQREKKQINRNSLQTFTKVMKNKLEINNTNQVTLFGTGPSLSKYKDIKLPDGLRIACNTIVKDIETMNIIEPDIVVAADALYHFGNNEHSKRFLADLSERLKERDFLFLYPIVFDFLIKRVIPLDAHHKLIPISSSRKKRNENLFRSFTIPNQGNILNLLLIPLAVTLGKKVFLLGFDGRESEDEGFWKNSELHSYPDLLIQLKKENTEFFRKHIPISDPNKYVNDNHGQVLLDYLDDLMRVGYEFELLSPSKSPGFSRLSVKIS